MSSDALPGMRKHDTPLDQARPACVPQAGDEAREDVAGTRVQQVREDLHQCADCVDPSRRISMDGRDGSGSDDEADRWLRSYANRHLGMDYLDYLRENGMLTPHQLVQIRTREVPLDEALHD